MRLFHFDGRALGRVAAAAALILLLMPAASAANKKKNAPEKVDITKLVWPPPPDQPRIRYLGQYNGELDLLGKKKVKGGMLERLAGISVTPEERLRMIKPYGVAVDGKGRVYVADTPQHLVFVFDLDQNTVELRGDKAPANLEMPIGVAVDGLDRLFVSDSKSHQITCFAADGKLEAVFGAANLVRPAGMAVDNALHRLYVADVGGRRIAVFDLQTLKLVDYFAAVKDKDKDADRTGALTNPNSIAIDPDGLVYVTDAVVPQVFVYDTDGNFVRVWGRRGDGPGMFGRPKGIGIDADGHVYVADAQLNRVQVFSPEGTALLSFASAGLGPGRFSLMAGLAVDSRNRVIVVDQMPARIQLFRYVTDAEASAPGKLAGKSGQAPAATAQQQPSAKATQPATKPAAPSGPTVEELQKELEALKAKLAAQEKQKSEPAGGQTKQAEKPAQEQKTPQ